VTLLIIKTGCEIRPGGQEQLLPPDHHRSGFGCERFTGTLAADEEHEHRCALWLHQPLPEGLQHDILDGNEDELALTYQDIAEPL